MAVGQSMRCFSLVRALVLSVLIFFLLPQCGSSFPQTVRITLFEPHTQLQSVTITAPFAVKSPLRRVVKTGNYRIHLTYLGVTISPLGFGNPAGNESGMSAREFVIEPANSKGVCLRLDDQVRHYSGSLVVSMQANSKLLNPLKIENIVDARQYVETVAGSETAPACPKEAIKAQAVLTQTRLFRYRPGDALGDSTQQEAYLGCDYIRPGIRDAVKDVWGRMLTFDGRPITVFYHSSCAGGTSRAVDVFGKGALKMPYLTHVDCHYCKDAPFWNPTTTYILQSEFKQQFKRDSVQVDRLDAARRPLSITLSGGKERLSISGYDFWIKLGQKFGWDKAPGTRYEIKPTGDGKLQIVSTGAGHGVGMCQWGAANLARHGKTYKEILQYYYPGTKITAFKF